jgi:tetratricopeptide (TPR) repeat protein
MKIRKMPSGALGARLSRVVALAGATTMMIAGASSARANQNPPSGNSPPPAAQGGRGGRGPAIDPAEETAFKAFNAAGSDPAGQIKAGQDFETKFPNSRYLEVVQSTMVNLYYNQQDFSDFYAEGDKVLAKNPDNVPVLTLVGWMIPRDYKADDPTEPAKLDKSEKYCKHALEVIPTLTKPAPLSDDQFNQAKASAASQAHSGLGMTYFRRNDFADSAKELETATTESPDVDPADLYILGVDYQKLNRDSDAAGVFAHCAEMPGSLQDRCKQSAPSLQGSAPAPAK